MTIYHKAANAEADEKMGLAALLMQSSPGIAKTGVLYGLAITQTTTASGSVQIGMGAGVVQASLTAGASLLYNPAPTLDIFTANPVGSLPRNDIIVFDGTSGTVKAVIGTANATPADPTVTSSQLKLARLSHAANATTIPAAKIVDLRTYTTLVPTTLQAWTSSGLSLATGANQGAIGSNLQWRIHPDTNELELFGGVTATTTFASAGVTLATLPVGARPKTLTYAVVPTNYSSTKGATARIEFQPDGTMNLFCQDGTTWVRFDKVRFDLP